MEVGRLVGTPLEQVQDPLLYSRFSLNQCSTPTHVRFYIYTLLTFFKASPIF